MDELKNAEPVEPAKEAENKETAEREKREQFLNKPAKERRDLKLKLAVGEEVEIAETGKPGVIKSVHQDESGTVRYAVSYNDDNGDEQRGWFEADEFTAK